MKKRILIADDEARVRLIVHDSLRKIESDWEIVTASNGLDALRRAEERPFDLVITDIRMPGMNGVELTRNISEIDPDTRVIWMTAYGCHRTLAESAELHVFLCLDKPIEIGEIRRAAREALDGPMQRPRRVLLPEEDHAKPAYAR